MTSSTHWRTPLPREIYSIAARSPGAVLFETARFDACNRRSLLFLDPVRTLAAGKLEEIPGLFVEIEEALAQGFYLAGYVSYEAGYHFQGLANLLPREIGHPLLWFGVYREPRIFDYPSGTQGTGTWSGSQFPGALGTPEATIPFRGPIGLEIDEEEYASRLRRIRHYIEQGDTYQVNFTDRVRASTTATPESVFETIMRRQPVSYGAFLHLGAHCILSFSPELLFRREGEKITVRPMKGTMPRGLDAAEDRRMELRLKADAKNHSEHVMIVDLLRNDLGRICTMGSIREEDLFHVEKYRTLFQMTSAISGSLRPGLSYYEIFKSIFPSGSITGAPKIRTMQIIRELERRPRGVYTGSIGFICPDRKATFNVAIRTLVMKGAEASMGVGGGIVADSDPASEYRECLLKASFLVRACPQFQLLETMLWDKEYVLLPHHLDRLASSAAYFDFVFDRQSADGELARAAASFSPDGPRRLRLLLSEDGRITITSRPFTPDQWNGRILLSTKPTFSGDVFLRHKTTHREFYDRQYASARAEGFDEVIFLNERGEITEGAISSLFARKDGKLLTPPLASGALPGVYRRFMLEDNPVAREEILTIEDLRHAEAIYLCNSVRGMRAVRTICLDVFDVIEFL